MTFKEWLFAFRTDQLGKDATWRAYDIFGSVHPQYVNKGLKDLGYAYAGELALSTFMNDFKVPTRDEAQAILAAWWLWSRIDAGKLVFGVRKRGPQTGKAGWGSLAQPAP